MKVRVNGEAREVTARTLAALLDELGFARAAVATAVNGVFTPAGRRSDTPLRDGDTVEVLAPMQGG